MSVTVSFDELSHACEWVASGETAAMDCKAYINRETGQIHWCGDGIDEEPPEDIEDGSLYIAVPRKQELHLGRSLALRFVEEHLPRSSETVYGFFRRPGAFSRFRALLADVGQLDAWHAYEQAATENAMREWCEENGFVLVR